MSKPNSIGKSLKAKKHVLRPAHAPSHITDAAYQKIVAKLHNEIAELKAARVSDHAEIKALEAQLRKHGQSPSVDFEERLRRARERVTKIS